MKDNVIKVDFSKNTKKRNASFLSSVKSFLSNLFSSTSKNSKTAVTKDKDTKKIIDYFKDIS